MKRSRNCDDHDAEAVLVAELVRHHGVRQAAQQAGQLFLGVGLRGREREQVEDLGLELGIGFEADGVGRR